MLLHFNVLFTNKYNNLAFIETKISYFHYKIYLFS